MTIRPSEEKDIPRIMEIFAGAREFMAANGNPHQWGDTNWPPLGHIERDAREGGGYVCEHEGRIVGYFFVAFGEDVEPDFRVIEGEWLDPSPYGALHRLAGDGSVRGIGEFCLNWVCERFGHIRFDTHEDNKKMQALAERLGFVRCGIIHVSKDPYPRIAYERSALTERIRGR